MIGPREVALADICEAIVDCEHKTAPTQATGIPLIRTTDIQNGKLNLDSAKRVSEENCKEWSQRIKPEPEDIILAREAPVGEVGYVPRGQRVCLGQRTVIIRINAKIAYPRYILYLFCSPPMRFKMASLAAGSVVPHLNMEDIRKMTLPELPSFPQQKVIGDILGSLDDKIDFNQQMNRTLEAVGQAVFGRWFVDFEFPNEEGKPYKSSGGEMVNNELLGKGIPRGWAVRELSDFIRFIKGKKPILVSVSQEEGFLPQILIDALDGMQPSFAQTEDMVVTKESDILMVMDGASSGRVERGHKGVLGSTLAVIEVKEIGSAYIYHFLKGREENINQNTTGTSIPHADKNMVGKYLVVVPGDERITNQFETISRDILFKSINNKFEIQTLQQIRDSLLPKLMSGKIRVPVPKDNVESN